MPMRSRLTVLLVALAAILAACASSGSASPSASTAPDATMSAPASTAPSAAPSASAASMELTIYAAASLKATLEKARTQFEAANPGTTLVISTDASSALETKIEQGAPADLFLSADTTNPQKLVGKGLTVGQATDFAKNKLTVIVPKDNPARIQTPKDLANNGVKIIAAGDAVPITKYATQLIANLAKQPGYPMNYVAAYEANIASSEENVGAVVAKIATGQGDAGIVYVTDSNGKADITPVAVPADANVIATYAGVVVKPSPNPEAAQAFLIWFAGPDGQAILSSFGFLPPS
jgi:molybdate transport system substrate-binding protein